MGPGASLQNGPAKCRPALFDAADLIVLAEGHLPVVDVGQRERQQRLSHFGQIQNIHALILTASVAVPGVTTVAVSAQTGAAGEGNPIA